MTPEAIADSEGFRADLATRIANATGSAVTVPAPSTVEIWHFGRFWAAVSRGLVGTGYEVKPESFRDNGRARLIGPVAAE